MMLREFALQVVRRLREQGFQSLWAGGCVRDQLLGLEPHDFDVATDAIPSEVQRIFRRSLAVGAQFGVIEVLGPAKGLHVQVATFRSDGSYLDGRHPTSVRFGSPQEDALRRDFTINGLFFDPLTSQVIDFVGGELDLRNRCLRAIGHAQARFTEDKLRLLRAVRFAARYDLMIDQETAEAMRAMAPEVIQVSAERITDELRKIAALPQRAVAFNLLRDSGLLRAVLGPWYAETATSFRTLAALEKGASFPLILALTLQELWGPGLDTLLQQHPISRLAQRLKISNDERDRLEWLLRERDTLRQSVRLPASRLKPLLANPWNQDLLLGLAARLAAAGEVADCVTYCRSLLAQTPPEELNPPPLVTGDDLRRAGYEPGPRFKEWLAQVRKAQLDGEIRTTAEGLALVRAWVQKTKKEPT